LTLFKPFPRVLPFCVQIGMLGSERLLATVERGLLRLQAVCQLRSVLAKLFQRIIHPRPELSCLLQLARRDKLQCAALACCMERATPQCVWLIDTKPAGGKVGLIGSQRIGLTRHSLFSYGK
jgi:hypothetical protein